MSAYVYDWGKPQEGVVSAYIYDWGKPQEVQYTFFSNETLLVKPKVNK